MYGRTKQEVKSAKYELRGANYELRVMYQDSYDVRFTNSCHSERSEESL